VYAGRPGGYNARWEVDVLIAEASWLVTITTTLYGYSIQPAAAAAAAAAGCLQWRRHALGDIW